MPTRKKGLPELRKEIDTIDHRILEFISRRARVAGQIGRAKTQSDRGVLDVDRENKVIRAIRKANKGPLPDDDIEAVFREIISACRASQQPTTVAYLGPAGTFTHEAAIKQFGKSADFRPVGSIADVFNAVETRRCSFGVVPIENTTEGAVTPTLDSLAETSATILAEVVVKIDHWLLAGHTDASKIRRIASHPQALAQCRRYLAQRFPDIELIAAASSAAAARMAGEKVGTAAVASKLARKLYDLKPLARSIQDNSGNVTRFLVLGTPGQGRPSENDRTSLVVSVQDRVGILEKIIRQFSRNGVNLSMIESRPLVGRPWEYRFFIDVSGHRSDESVEKALASVERIALSVKVLGSYPVAQ